MYRLQKTVNKITLVGNCNFKTKQQVLAGWYFIAVKQKRILASSVIKRNLFFNIMNTRIRIKTRNVKILRSFLTDLQSNSKVKAHLDRFRKKVGTIQTWWRKNLHFQNIQLEENKVLWTRQEKKLRTKRLETSCAHLPVPSISQDTLQDVPLQSEWQKRYFCLDTNGTLSVYNNEKKEEVLFEVRFILLMLLTL